MQTRAPQRPWDMATFQLGSPLFIKATDSDEDPDPAGDSTLEDDVNDELTDKDELDEDKEKDPDTDEDKDKEDDKPKRFASHEAAEEGFSELQSHASRLEQENQALRRHAAGKKETTEEDTSRSNVGDDFNEAAMATAIADAVDKEVSALPKEQQSLRATTVAIVREVLKSVKPMTEQVADRIAVTRSSQAMSQETVRAKATENAQAALKAVGLDKPQHMELLHNEIGRRRAEDPEGWQRWVESTKPDAQFKELAQGVLRFVKSIGGTTVDAVKEANRKHREDADSMDSGRRSFSRTPKGSESDEDGDDKGGTMLDALVADQASLRRRGRHFATQFAGRR